jgi:hypothetical protein
MACTSNYGSSDPGCRDPGSIPGWVHFFLFFFCFAPFTLYQKPVTDHCPWPSSQFDQVHSIWSTATLNLVQVPWRTFLLAHPVEYFTHLKCQKRIGDDVGDLKPHCIRCSHFKVDDVSALEPSSKPPVHIVEDNVTQRHCISNVRHDPGYGLDAVTTWRGFASAGRHKHLAGLNTV